ncbi:hypothetical protein P740_004930 [Helicobacter pylori E48]|uniref:hypothetical protein n=1 Tax=Helicobacter pylori TaxID=210 RepID=UPI0004A440DA|nr:hypothetical protein [Helicobacter pylori]NOK31004.1 hypothetical protein [Helicobacter pylori E48]
MVDKFVGMVDKFVGMVDKFVGGWLYVVVLIVFCVVFFPLIMRVFVWFGRFFTILLIAVLFLVFPSLIVLVPIVLIWKIFFDDDDDD